MIMEKGYRRVHRYRHIVPYEDSFKDYGRRLSPEHQRWLVRFLDEYYYNALDKNPAKRLHQHPGKDGQKIWVTTNARNEDLFTRLNISPQGGSTTGLVREGELQEDEEQESDLFGPSPELDPEQTLMMKELVGDNADVLLSGTSPKQMTIRHTFKNGMKVVARAQVSLDGRGRVVRNLQVTTTKGEKAFLDHDQHLELVQLFHASRPERSPKTRKRKG